MLFVMETVFEIKSHTLPCYFFREGYCLGECRLSILFKVYSEVSLSKNTNHIETNQWICFAN